MRAFINIDTNNDSLCCQRYLCLKHNHVSIAAGRLSFYVTADIMDKNNVTIQNHITENLTLSASLHAQASHNRFFEAFLLLMWISR